MLIFSKYPNQKVYHVYICIVWWVIGFTNQERYNYTVFNYLQNVLIYYAIQYY